MVYIDPPLWRFKGKLYCHMVADSITELHEFAESIGLKRCWFENKKGRNQPHYDLSPDFQVKAIRAGAKEVSARNMLIVMDIIRSDGQASLF